MPNSFSPKEADLEAVYRRAASHEVESSRPSTCLCFLLDLANGQNQVVCGREEAVNPAPPKGFVFDGFVSYSTDPDSSLVGLVEGIIEGFHRRPGIARDLVKELSLCVDGSDFIYKPQLPNVSTTEVIGDVIKENLRASRCLVVFGGPSTRNHTWINQEIRWWREDRPNAPVYFALTHGCDPDLTSSRNVPLALQAPHKPAEFSFDLRGYYRLSLFERIPADVLLFTRAMRRRLSTLSSRKSLPDASAHNRSSTGPTPSDQDDAPERSRAWKSVGRFHREVARLAAQLVHAATGQPRPLSELQATYVEVERRAQRRARVWTAAGFGAIFAVGVTGYVVNDRTQRIRTVAALASDARAAVEQGDYERAIDLTLKGLPVRGDVPWALGWSDTRISSLQAILAGSAQMSALVGIVDERATDPDARLTSVAINADGSRLVVASEAGSSSIYALPSLQRSAVCKQNEAIPIAAHIPVPGGTRWVRDSQFGGDNVLSVGPSGHIWVWDAQSRDCASRVLLRPHTQDARSGVFSPDPSHQFVLTTSDDGRLMLTDWRTTVTPIALPEPRWPWAYTTSAAFDESGQSIVVARSDGLVAVLDISTKKWTSLQTGGAHVNSVRFSRDASRIVAASWDGRTQIWDRGPSRLTSSKEVKVPAPAWERRSWSEALVLPLAQQDREVNDAIFSPDGRFIATAGADGTARIWSVQDLTQRFVFRGHKESVTRVEFTPDGRAIVSASADGTARIWDTNVAPPSAHTHNAEVSIAVRSHDGSRLLTSSRYDRQTFVWSVDNLGHLVRVDEIKANQEVAHADFGRSADEVFLALKGGRIIRYVVSTRESVLLCPGGGPEISSIASNKSGTQVAVAFTAPHEGATAFVLELANHGRTVLKGVPPDARAAFTLDDERIIVISKTGISGLWDVRTGELASRLHGTPGDVRDIAFTRDGTRAVTVGTDYQARIWDLQSGTEVLSPFPHQGDVYSANFTADGNRLVTASGDRNIRVWDALRGNLILKQPLASAGIAALLTSDDSKLIAVTEDGLVRTFDISWTALRGTELARRVCDEKVRVKRDDVSGAGQRRIEGEACSRDFLELDR